MALEFSVILAGLVFLLFPLTGDILHNRRKRKADSERLVRIMAQSGTIR